MGLPLFSFGSSAPETVAGIMNQFTDLANRLDAVVDQQNELVAKERAVIEEAQARIDASTDEISAATKAAKNIRALLG